MRRLLVTLAVLALSAPLAATASRTDPGDGTLSVKDGRGVFAVAVKGGIIGSFARGSVVITDPIPSDGTGPIVSGDDWQIDRSDTTTVYGGTKVRFRVIGGRFRVRVQGTGVNLSVVGKGQVVIHGRGTGDDGMYSVNGGAPAAVPDFLQFVLSASSP